VPTFNSLDKLMEYNSSIMKKENFIVQLSIWTNLTGSIQQEEKYTQPSLYKRAKDINGFPLPDEIYVYEIRDEFWGGSTAKNFIAKVEKPTWLTMWRVADSQCKALGDLHHVFFEGIVRDDNAVGINNVPVYKLYMGS
jgi:hypothetical protein